MEVVGIVVGRELIGLAVELELAVGDAVGDPPGGAAEVRAASLVGREVVEPEDDVSGLAVADG